MWDRIDAFPRLQDIHPFHRDLLNTLYDADHFRIALGQLSTAKSLIEAVSRDYVRLLKYGQSLFQWYVALFIGTALWWLLMPWPGAEHTGGKEARAPPYWTALTAETF